MQYNDVKPTNFGVIYYMSLTNTANLIAEIIILCTKNPVPKWWLTFPFPYRKIYNCLLFDNPPLPTWRLVLPLNLTYLYFTNRRHDTSVDIVTRLRAGRSGFDSRRGLGIFLVATASRQALGPTQSPIQWVLGLFPWIKRPGHEADHSHLVSRLRMRGAIPPLPQYVFMAWCLLKALGQIYL
jgi:hypothetical protein